MKKGRERKGNDRDKMLNVLLKIAIKVLIKKQSRHIISAFAYYLPIDEI